MELLCIFNNIYLDIIVEDIRLFETCRFYFSGYHHVNEIPLNVDFHKIYVSKVNELIDKEKVIRKYDNGNFVCKSMRSWAFLNVEKMVSHININKEDSSNIIFEQNLLSFFLTELLTRISFKDGILPFHASAVGKNNFGFLLMGQPGIGKTTTALNLLNYGFDLISDDRPLVDFNGCVHYFSRPVNISVDVLNRIECRHLDVGQICMPSSCKKISIPSIEFYKGGVNNKFKIKKILILEKNQINSSPTFKKLDKVESFMKILHINYPFYASQEQNLLLDICKYYSENFLIYSSNIKYTQKWLEEVVNFFEGEMINEC